MVAFAVAVSSGDAFTPTVVDGARTAADATGIEHQTGPVIVGRGSFVVACVSIRAACNFFAVTDSVRIDIPRAVPAADAEGVELVAIAVTVASRNGVASAVVDGARSIADAAIVVVAHAVVDVVAESVAVRICRTVPTADAEGVELVAVTIAFSFSNAFSTANAAFIQLGARTVVFAGVRIKIAGAGIGAPENRQVEVQVDGPELVVALEKDLDVEVAAERAVCGELGNEDALVRSSDAIGVAGLGEPRAPGHVIELESTAGKSIARFEHRLPGLRRGLDREHIALTVGCVCGLVQADGDEAVVLVRREAGPNRRHDAAGRDVTDWEALEEVASGEQGGRSVNVAEDGGQLVVGAACGHEQPVARVAGEVGVWEHPDVLGDRVDFNAVVVRLEDMGSRRRNGGHHGGGLTRDVSHKSERKQQEDPSPDGMA